MKYINAIFIIIFVAIICIFPDIDYLSLANKYHINNTIFGLLLLCLAGFGIYMLKHNKTLSTLTFIVFFMLMRTKFNYVELFENNINNIPVSEFNIDSTNTTIPQTRPLLTEEDLTVAQDFLLKQTQADPNKTPLEKQVINDIITHYFVKSDKLTQLRNFNVSAQVANPIPGDQKLTPDF